MRCAPRSAAWQFLRSHVTDRPGSDRPGCCAEHRHDIAHVGDGRGFVERDADGAIGDVAEIDAAPLPPLRAPAATSGALDAQRVEVRRVGLTQAERGQLASIAQAASCTRVAIAVSPSGP